MTKTIRFHEDELQILQDFLEKHLTDIGEMPNEYDGYLLGVYDKTVKALASYDAKNAKKETSGR